MRDKITISIPGAGKDVYYLSPEGEEKSEKSETKASTDL
jgi:hypothetical protein